MNEGIIARSAPGGQCAVERVSVGAGGRDNETWSFGRGGAVPAGRQEEWGQTP
jgi:hypothetical protein